MLGLKCRVGNSVTVRVSSSMLDFEHVTDLHVIIIIVRVCSLSRISKILKSLKLSNGSVKIGKGKAPRFFYNIPNATAPKEILRA